MARRSSSLSVRTRRRSHRRKVTRGERTEEPFLASFCQIPEYMRCNDAILGGYRMNFNTWGKACVSLFQLHNETLNVWTHLLGWVLMITLMFYALQTWLAEATTTTKAMFLVWNIAAQLQMLASSYYHQFCCLSRRCWGNLQKLDYTAIAVLICGSHFPIIHYAMYCNPNWKLAYLGLVVGIAAASIAMSWTPYFLQPAFNTPRVFLFILTAISFLIAAPHWLQFIPSLSELSPVAWRLGLMGVCYIGGACIYANRWPEVFWPGKCDTWFHSHIIWHIFVIMAAWFMYCVCEKSHEWHMASLGRCDMVL